MTNIFCFVASYLFLIWLVLMALFWAAVRRNSDFRLTCSFFSHVHVFSWEMSLVRHLKRPHSCFSFHFCFLVIFVLLISVLSVIIIYSFRVFHISVSWWFFTGVWVTASLLKSPGLVSVFWTSSAMLSFGLSPTVRQFPSPPGPLIIL